MTNYDFYNDIPAAANDPSLDQPKMLINNISTDGILAQDHVSFKANNGGMHKQVNFYDRVAQAAQTDPSSVLYTASGSASTVSDMRFSNQNGVFPVNALRACGVFTTQNSNGAVVSTMSFNVNTVTASSNGIVYTVALTPGAVSGTVVMVLLNLTNDGTLTWTYALNTLTIGINTASTNSQKLSFFVFQI